MVSTLEIFLYNLVYVGLVYGAVIFQKVGVTRSPRFGEEKYTAVLKNLAKNKLWLTGILLNIVSVPYFAALLSVSTISFIMVCQRLGLIIIFIFSIKYMKERFKKTEIMGLIVVFASMLLMVSVFTNSQATSFYVGDLQGFLFFIVCGVIEVVTLLSYSKMKNLKIKEVILAVGAGMSGVAGTIALKVVPLVLHRDLGMDPDVSYFLNMFNLPEFFTIFFSIFVPGSPYFFGAIYLWLWISNFMANFFLLTMMYQHGRAGVTIPINTSLNFLISILFGFFMCAEPIDTLSWVGISFMVFGILLTSKIESEAVVKKPSPNNVTAPNGNLEPVFSPLE
jgi:drug/metabolite transporter (DMT)-like permease